MEGYPSSQKALFVLLVENTGILASELPSLKDEDFIRHEKVPMTKREVRALSLSALSLSKDSVFYDVGSGSGSVTVEGARLAYEGQVFALECNEEALALTKANIEEFSLENVSLISGSAPQCLENLDLPAPTHVFIGGSKGNFGQICRFFLKKNPRVKIAANFVSLEGLFEMQKFLSQLEEENFAVKDLEISQIGVSRAQKTGNFNLLKALNPVYIVSFTGSGPNPGEK
ncbi:MAG: precorrin-6Y C5,15-methyltransferase (decarboxylating) subunit CbiT [Treponema sp.]|nr:precorrin-6Y C5,15-methyltransferase (decarboxylating) subunit CbiT [Treponema sp.]